VAVIYIRYVQARRQGGVLGVQTPPETMLNFFFRGVQKFVTDKAPRALYVHCAAHSLNLAIGKSCDVPALRNCIGSVSSVANFFRASPKRVDVLKKTIEHLIPDSR